MMVEQIFRQAERQYPSECCGIILGPSEMPGIFSRLRPCGNAQDREHEKDPARFSRTGGTAYFIDPADLLLVHKEARAGKETFRAIYHSHIDAEAYFSDEDTRMAAPEGEALYPEAVYLVVSVKAGKAGGVAAFAWDGAARAFQPLKVNLF